jgi:ribosome-associated translation inhibitor RaiA
MNETLTVVVRFKDAENDEDLREDIERRARELAEEISETSRFEIQLAPDGIGFRANGHVLGKGIDVTTHGEGSDLRVATDQLFRRLVRQLRRAHEKRIFLRRREAQKSSPKN